MLLSNKQETANAFIGESPHMETVDLRSDTVTLPTDEMLEAIKRAKLGDDVFREDPTVNRLQEMAAERMGMEAALLVATGTQANLVSLMSNTKHGDLVILESESHIYWYEVGGISAVAGLLPWPLKSSCGSLDPEAVTLAIKPSNIHFPEATLLCVEDTHNRHGGTIIRPEQLKALSEVAKVSGLRFYMDGARIFNASVALKVDVKEFTRHVDNLMFCLSKGLSCPAGSIIAGSEEFIERARKNRKLLGGGMRQAGIIAAPGIIALEKMVDRLEEDHANAKRLAEGISKVSGITINKERVQTNILLLDITELGISDGDFLARLKSKGVLALTHAEHIVRLVTHRGIKNEHVEKAINAIKFAADETRLKTKI
jgi:threonine aldolase